MFLVIQGLLEVVLVSTRPFYFEFGSLRVPKILEIFCHPQRKFIDKKEICHSRSWHAKLKIVNCPWLKFICAENHSELFCYNLNIYIEYYSDRFHFR